MSVRFGTADPFPYACIEYVCVCGATAHTHGTGTRSLPAGWSKVGAPREGDEAVHVCPRCAAATGARAPAP